MARTCWDCSHENRYMPCKIIPWILNCISFTTSMSASYQKSDHLSEQVATSLFLFSVSKTDYNDNNSNGFLYIMSPRPPNTVPRYWAAIPDNAQININCDVHHRANDASDTISTSYIFTFFTVMDLKRNFFGYAMNHTSFILYLMGTPIPSRSEPNLNFTLLSQSHTDRKNYGA